MYKVEKTSHILNNGTLLLMLDLAGSAQGLARQINCLAVHPSRPHLCVTGASSGMLALWDLRMTSAPAVHSAARPGAGEVLEVTHTPKMIIYVALYLMASWNLIRCYLVLSLRSHACVLLEPSTLLAGLPIFDRTCERTPEI